jgi:hypothetical protein
MQFLSGSHGGKTPRKGGFGRVAFLFIRGNFLLKRGVVGDAPRQTLPTQNAQLALRPIQPTAVLRRVMHLQFLQQAAGLRWGKGLIQRGRLVGMEVIQQHPNPLRLRVPLIDQPLHVLGKGPHRPLCRDRNVAPAGVRRCKQKKVAGAVALVRIVLPCGLPGLGGPGRACLADPLLARFITVARRALEIVWRCVQGQDVLQGGHELGTPFWQTPLLGLPRVAGIFLSTWRPVSWAIAAATPNAPPLSARSRSGPRARPAGAGVQATAITCAACKSVHCRCAPGRACSLRAPRCSSTKRCRVRPTVAVPPSRATAISSSLQPSLALSRRRARVSLRAPAFPRRRRGSTVVRSAALNATGDFFLGMSRHSVCSERSRR